MTFGRKLTELEWAVLRQQPGVINVTVDTQGEYNLEVTPPQNGTLEQLIGTLVSELAKQGIVPRSVKEGASLEEKFLQATGHAGGFSAGN